MWKGAVLSPLVEWGDVLAAASEAERLSLDAFGLLLRARGGPDTLDRIRTLAAIAGD
ncbi:MAG: hypothetical protein M3452_04385 [Chloroflexota bacterium]|nr:hypothetical protein [Chloroflexota bacterium]